VMLGLSPAGIFNRIYRGAWKELLVGSDVLCCGPTPARHGIDDWLKIRLEYWSLLVPDQRLLAPSPHSLELNLDRLRAAERVTIWAGTSRPIKATRAIGDTLGDDWKHGDLVGDEYLFGRVRRLGDERLPKPLLHLSGDSNEMRSTMMELTPFGRDVAEGRASNYPTNPIEDWVGGVSLSSANGRLWFNDGGRIVAAA